MNKVQYCLCDEVVGGSVKVCSHCQLLAENKKLREALKEIVRKQVPQYLALEGQPHSAEPGNLGAIANDALIPVDISRRELR